MVSMIGHVEPCIAATMGDGAGPAGEVPLAEPRRRLKKIAIINVSGTIMEGDDFVEKQQIEKVKQG